MLSTTPQFVRPEDFLNYYGINLNERLKSNANISNKADTFLKRIEDRLMSWVDANSFRDFHWEELRNDYQETDEYRQRFKKEQKELWQKAILAQAMYVFRNSEIGFDSGYDPGKGIIAEKQTLDEIEICRIAIDFLKEAGILNHVVKNRLRYTSFS